MPKSPEINLTGSTSRVFLWQFFLLGLLLLGLGYPSFSAAQLIAHLQFPQAFPERDVLIVAGSKPEWKRDWESGRRLVRAGDLQGAVESYQRLLSAKANIEQARWELAILLAGLGDWEKSRSELELLVENAPDNVEYLNALGVALRHTGQLRRALDIFGKVRERVPGNFIALVGQAQGLVEAGRKREALPLIQEIVARKPDDRGLSLALASLAYEQGQMELARKLLVTLAADKKVELDTLLLAARLHEAMGREKEAAAYRERLLVMDPANREAHGWLAKYQETQGRPDKALPHLQALLVQEPENIAILAKICRFYLNSAGRFAEALTFYGKYVRLRPDDLNFIRSVIAKTAGREDEQVAFFRLLLAVFPKDPGLFTKLAAGWESAGNPERALEMWERLTKLAPERVEVYRSLVPLLGEPGREARLIEVLETIHGLAPNDQEVIGRLARLVVSRRDLTAGLGYYNKLEQTGYGGSDLYAGRSALYEEMGQPSRALADYKKLLALSPEAGELRRRGLILAGELGDVNYLVQVAARLDSWGRAGDDREEMLVLAEAFASARDLSRAVYYYRLVLTGSAGKGEGGAAEALGTGGEINSRQARLGLAQLYLREGLPFEAEQVLREGLLFESDQGVFLLRLFELSMAGDPPDSASARVWLDQYLRLSQIEPAEAAFLQARLLAASGETAHAAEDLRSLLAKHKDAAAQSPKEVAKVIRRARLLLAEISLAAGELPEAERECLLIAGAEVDPEVLVLLQAIYLQARENMGAATVQQRLMQAESDGIRLLELAELFHKRGLPEAQASIADKVIVDWPGSLRAAFVKAEALIKAGRYGEALQLGDALAGDFPDSLSVASLKARLHYHAGQYPEAIQLCKLVLATEPDRFDIRFLMVWCEMARGNQAGATRLVQELYPVEGSRLLFKRLIDAGLTVPPPRKRTWWQILTFNRPPFDLAVEMLRADFFFDQRLPEKRKVNELVASMSVWLRWEKSFRAALVGG